MKFICLKENLVDGINIVQKAVSSKSTMQILEGILIECTDTLKLTGNDLEIGIECIVTADIINAGSIVINSKIFGEIIRKLPDGEVSVELINNNIIIDCEYSHFEIKGLPADSFPSIPTIEKDNVFYINQKLFKEMIRQTIFSVGVDENRPVLLGSLLEVINNTITVVAIDGYRLALRKHISSKDINNLKVIIPGKTFGEIIKIMQSIDSDLIIYTTKNQIMFDLGNCKMVSRLIDGEYLNYNSIIPKEFETEIILNRRELLSSIERAVLINNDDKKYPVKFNIKDEKLIITCNTDSGNLRDEINISMSGNKIEVGFNPKYFCDALRVIEDDEIKIHFSSSIGPCSIHSLNHDEYTYMILPVRIKAD